MSYAGQEESTYEGSPIELYLFERGTQNWAYTSADTDQTYLSVTYEAVPITRSEIESSQDLAKQTVTFTMPSDSEVLEGFKNDSPSELMTIKILRFHEGDSEVLTRWVGRVMTVGFEGYSAEVSCDSAFTSMRLPMGRRLYQAHCAYALYGAACGVNKSSFEVTATITGITGLNIAAAEFSAQPDGYWVGGIMNYVNGLDQVVRHIVAHSGTVVTIDRPLTGASATDTVVVVPGCDKTTDTCNDTFNNILNFGGQPFIPRKNPFIEVIF